MALELAGFRQLLLKPRWSATAVAAGGLASNRVYYGRLLLTRSSHAYDSALRSTLRSRQGTPDHLSPRRRNSHANPHLGRLPARYLYQLSSLNVISLFVTACRLVRQFCDQEQACNRSSWHSCKTKAVKNVDALTEGLYGCPQAQQEGQEGMAQEY